MENQQPAEGPKKKSKGFTLFAAKRIIVGAIGVLALIWAASYVLSLYETHEAPSAPHAPKIVAEHAPTDDRHAEGKGHDATAKSGHGTPANHGTDSHGEGVPKSAAAKAASDHDDHGAGKTDPAKTAPSHGPAAGDHAAAKQDTHAAGAGSHGAATKHKDHATTVGEHAAKAAHGEADAHGGDHGHGTIEISDIKGVTFVMATIAPLQYELEERFYGWRPNDIIRPADNVKNYQLGVLEVTRRTVEALTERISRTGSAQAFDKDLERARNNLMINADDYMLPSAESSYAEALEALERFKAKLENGSAPFYTRTVNLIPLLMAYESLLGSCDDNLVKAKEDDGSEVSWFRADDYFFYAQGVAYAMQTILQAVAVDFETVIESRRGTDVLHHAVEALHHATGIHPWIILDGDPDGFTANHRANLAAPISHARFYVALLIQTLST